MDGCGSDEDCSEGPSYLGNDELQLEELDALAREVTSADIASSDGAAVMICLILINAFMVGWLLGYLICTNIFINSLPFMMVARYISKPVSRSYKNYY